MRQNQALLFFFEGSESLQIVGKWVGVPFPFCFRSIHTSKSRQLEKEPLYLLHP
ncbi:hypothetical protein SAMN05421852_108167 [Thermoflavimicrobium dichotomicum]|uniref:Uncharacterized protein n=1 Tax=Thermoflavimicrobium dichotomicum TaxID=46223 RepID=A0A1I3QZW3_9BACL|nr:hypothetical protein SAMN05421852_108167 [Thermoflavimicrobium dichotomicum]